MLKFAATLRQQIIVRILSKWYMISLPPSCLGSTSAIVLCLFHFSQIAVTYEQQLQDAKMPLARLQSMYTEMVILMRKLYQECRLVHGDLSEYNILVNEVSIWCHTCVGWPWTLLTAC